MSRRVSTTGGRKTNNRLYTILWVVGLAAIVITLIYLEQTAVLYILATLSVTALLLVVAMADLHGKQPDEPLPADDAAAIGSGIRTTLPPAKPAARSTRAARRK